MTTTITPSTHLERIYHLLTATYGEPKLIPDNDALGGLIGTILSQHTSDINSERAYQQLIATFPTWEEVRDAPTFQVAEAIRSGGLANIKALRLQDVLHTLTEQQHEAGQSGSLAAYLYNKLTSCSPEDAWHCSRRLGLIGSKVGADQAHEIFAKITPPEWVYLLHVNLIRHGRQICHAQHPECTQCTLYRECAYVGSVNPQETAIST